MDDINNKDFDLPQYDVPTNRTPRAIIEDASEQCYRVCFESTEAGIIGEDSRLIDKEELARDYPNVLKAWEKKIRNEKETANKQEEAFVHLAGQVLNRQDAQTTKMTAHREVDCDQKLLPGMFQHWGELRSCETHPQGRPECRVCKGCRVAQYALESHDFDRKVIMARGARAPVCTSCAKEVVAERGVGHRGCVCDSRWTCFRCREIELERLAKAREGYVEGGCGACGNVGDLVQYVDFCLCCKRSRVYAASVEDD